jgi:hypothetical protein
MHKRKYRLSEILKKPKVTLWMGYYFNLNKNKEEMKNVMAFGWM